MWQKEVWYHYSENSKRYSWCCWKMSLMAKMPAKNPRTNEHHRETHNLIKIWMEEYNDKKNSIIIWTDKFSFGLDSMLLTFTFLYHVLSLLIWAVSFSLQEARVRNDVVLPLCFSPSPHVPEYISQQSHWLAHQAPTAGKWKCKYSLKSLVHRVPRSWQFLNLSYMLLFFQAGL